MAGFLRRRVVDAAVGRGVFGESRFWLVVAAVLGVRWVVRRFAGDAPKVLYSEELGPHDRLLIGTVKDAADGWRAGRDAADGWRAGKDAADGRRAGKDAADGRRAGRDPA